MSSYTVRESPPDDCLQQHSPLLRALLFSRSLRSADEAERVLSASYERDLHDPFLLADMDAAVSRFLQAVEKKERIVIFGDFDADGICSTALWKDFFRRIGYDRVAFYIPHRHEEGFGVNVEALSSIANEGPALVITADCGIADAEALKAAPGLGLDVIVTDHHEVLNGLPSAVAVVNPKRSDCSYPNPHLCGAGVSFKFMQAILSRNRFGLKDGHEKWLLDLVGIATISDMVSLTGENRAFALYGLTVLRKSPRVGILRLCRTLNIPQRHMSEDDIGFMITPRLNAASRMGDTEDALMLLSTDSEAEAEAALKGLEKVNQERKGVVASIVKEIKKTITVTDDVGVIVTGNPNWRPSLLGLAANTIAEEFARPVFLWGRDGSGSEELKGSCRSDGTVNILTLMESAADVFAQYGGHAFAGGFSVSFKNVHTLGEHLNEAYRQNGCSVRNEEKIVDADLSLNDVTDRTYNEIERLAPFGIDNPKPLFRFKNVTIQTVRTFGKQGDHLELQFKKDSGGAVKAIGFFMTPESFARKIKEGERIDLIASLERSYFRGRPELRLRITDII